MAYVGKAPTGSGESFVPGESMPSGPPVWGVGAAGAMQGLGQMLRTSPIGQGMQALAPVISGVLDYSQRKAASDYANRQTQELVGRIEGLQEKDYSVSESPYTKQAFALEVVPKLNRAARIRKTMDRQIRNQTEQIRQNVLSQGGTDAAANAAAQRVNADLLERRNLAVGQAVDEAKRAGAKFASRQATADTQRRMANTQADMTQDKTYISSLLSAMGRPVEIATGVDVYESAAEATRWLDEVALQEEQLSLQKRAQDYALWGGLAGGAMDMVGSMGSAALMPGPSSGGGASMSAFASGSGQASPLGLRPQ